MKREQLIILICGLMLCLGNVSAQEKDEYNRNLDDLTLPKRGPDLDRYTHVFLGYGLLVGPSEDSAQIIYGKSSAFSVGYLFKRRLSKHYELGFDFSFRYAAYHLEQDSTKILPNPIQHNKEKIITNSLQLAVFQRIKLRNRTNSMGHFIDMGAYAGWIVRSVHFTQNRPAAASSNRTETKDIALDYVRSYSYGIMARVGFNRLAVFGRYRLSELFEDRFGYPSLPKMEVGLRLGIHQ